MTGRERALGAFNRTGYDRIPVKHEGTPEVNQMIMDHFGLTNMEQLLRVVGDDFRYVELPYTGPELRTFPDGSMEGYWGERYKYAQFEGGKYLEPLLPALCRDRQARRARPLSFSVVRLVRLLRPSARSANRSAMRATPSASERPGIWISSTASPGRGAPSRC